MKCHSCGKEMVNTIGGCYHCPHCGMGIHDGVHRPLEFDSGWNPPRIGRVKTEESDRPNMHIKPKGVFIGDTTLSNIIDRIVAVAESMNALAEELRKTMMDSNQGEDKEQSDNQGALRK